MPANSQRITATLAAGLSPPDSIIARRSTRRNSPHIVPMVTLSKAQLLYELSAVKVMLAAAEQWCQHSDTFRAEGRIRYARERLDKLTQGITGADDEFLHELRKQKVNASRGLY